MTNKRITTKINQQALSRLRKIAAHTGERQYEVLDRLLAAEWNRVKLAEAAQTPSPRSAK
jgi:hypothetical protein